jgi:hypothetical protein
MTKQQEESQKMLIQTMMMNVKKNVLIKKILNKWQIQALIVLIICTIAISYYTNKANKCVGYYSVGKCVEINQGRFFKKNYVIEYFDIYSNSLKKFEQINSSFKTKKSKSINQFFLIKICENETTAFINESIDSVNFGKEISSKRKISFIETLGFW